jgi:hypothetical protein
MRRGVGSQLRPAILRALTLLVAGLLFAPIPSGQATDGRDFAGFYEVDNPSDLGNGQVQITFAVRVFNYADYDVTAATVNLCDSSVPDVVYGTFPNVSLVQGQNLRLQGTFNIPQSEYDSWQNTEAGGGPRLWIEFTDANGNPVKLRIELVSAPVGEDN